jgi:16S rRNA (adenine1518-N6/adenine1519-N6)-dimethyltransferase
MNRTDPEELLERLKRAGVWSKKRLGQHFLVDPKALDAIIASAELDSASTVLEIGPGLGVLSERLLEVAGKVVACELDEDMVRILAMDMSPLHVVQGDVLKTAPEIVAGFPADKPYKVVANIPYQITSPLLRLFLEGEVGRQPESLTLLVQKEVGKRLAAKESKSDRSYLSVLAQYCAEVIYVRDVPAESFWPAPRVDSAVIHMKIRSVRALSGDEEAKFLRFVRTLFTQQRKQLKNVIAGIRGVGSAEVSAYLISQGLPETVRSQQLSLEQWLRLYQSQF